MDVAEIKITTSCCWK